MMTDFELKEGWKTAGSYHDPHFGGVAVTLAADTPLLQGIQGKGIELDTFAVFFIQGHHPEAIFGNTEKGKDTS